MTVLNFTAAGGSRDIEAAWWQGTTVSIRTESQQMATINNFMLYNTQSKQMKYSMAAQWKEILDVATKLRQVVRGQGFYWINKQALEIVTSDGCFFQDSNDTIRLSQEVSSPSILACSQ